MEFKRSTKTKIKIAMSQKEANNLLDWMNCIIEFLDECPKGLNGIRRPDKEARRVQEFANDLENAANSLLW